MSLRRALIDDSRDVWLWRNDPLTVSMSLSRETIPFDRHQIWYERVMSSPDKYALYISQSGNEKLGMVRFDLIDDHEAIVSINFAPAARGRGLSAPVLSEACARYFQSHIHVHTLHADVLHQNTPSLKIFRSVGFKEVESDADLVRFLYDR